MLEREFWAAMRFSIIRSGALSALGYCDWFEVKRYILGVPISHIDGLMGFVDGRRGDSYKFTLMLPQGVGSIDEIDWRGLLPNPESGTGWVTVEDDLITIDTVGTEGIHLNT